MTTTDRTITPELLSRLEELAKKSVAKPSTVPGCKCDTCEYRRALSRSVVLGLIEAARTLDKVRAALETDETGDALVEVARNAWRAEIEAAAAARKGMEK